MTADFHGKFVWHDLVTTDPAAAAPFYDKVIGWRAAPWDKDPSYTVLSGAHGPAAGLARLTSDVQGSGGTPHWLAFVGVRDLRASVEDVRRLGGKVLKDSTAIGDMGHYAIASDPNGAAFGMFTSAAPSSGGQMRSEFSWHELASTDHKAALRFYRELLGWEQIRVHDMGAMGEYLLFGQGGQEMGGMFTRPASAGGSANHWLCYARVTSAAGAADAAKAAGGRIVTGPTEVPGGSWVAQLLDPQGAAIAVHEPQRAAAASAPKRPAAAARTKPPQAASAAAPKVASATPAAAKRTHPKRPARKAAAKRASAKRAPAKAAKRGAARKASARPARAASKRGAARRSAKKKAPARKSSRRAGTKRGRAARGARRHR